MMMMMMVIIMIMMIMIMMIIIMMIMIMIMKNIKFEFYLDHTKQLLIMQTFPLESLTLN